jgi:hypothetical protein
MDGAMKNKNRWMVLGAFLVLMTHHANAAGNFISGVGATANSTSTGQSPSYMTDGSGLTDGFTGDPAATSVFPTSSAFWLSEDIGTSPTIAPIVEFDLGGSYDLETMVVWNHIEEWDGHSDFGLRGFKYVDIEYLNGGTWTLLDDANGVTAGTHSIGISGEEDEESNLSVDMTGITAEKVRITGLANWNDNYWGLNEVRFYEVPEPATMSLLALGGIAMLKRRKK